MSSFCCKTFSPFFSSQERLTQCAWEGDRLVACAEQPIPPGQAMSFAWNAGLLKDGVFVCRSYNRDAFVVFFSPPGSHASGNGWPHCTHLGGPHASFDTTAERAILFMLGTETELRQAIAETRRCLPAG
jgi:hypothetical protein